MNASEFPYAKIILPRGLAMLLGLFLIFNSAHSHARENGSEAAEPYGLWLTENERSAIKITPCDSAPDKLCGHIAWIIDGGMQYDTENPDESLRDRPMCGLPILKKFDQAAGEPEKWRDGKIYKADEGDMYNASLTVMSEEKLRVRGYIGIPLFGKTQIWKKVSSENYPPCSPPD